MTEKRIINLKGGTYNESVGGDKPQVKRTNSEPTIKREDRIINLEGGTYYETLDGEIIDTEGKVFSD
jgi:hypothetical protein